MSSLWTTLLLTASWGAYIPSPAVLSTSLAPATTAASHETETTPARQATEITEANWRRHPKIRAVRKIVRSVEAGLKKGSYKTSERRFESCGDRFFTLRRIARDSKGVAVWYEDYDEGEDSSFDFFHYYDRTGRLRFVSALAYAANATL